MRLFDFLKRTKHQKETPSTKQTLFAEKVLNIIQPTVEKFGFIITKTEIKQYSTRIVWRKENLYIEVRSTTYPTDYPYYYYIGLGGGNSNNFGDYD